MNPSEMMTQVRIAHRLVHDYQRRVLDLLAYAVDRLRADGDELRFGSFLPIGIRGMGYNTDPTVARWAWEYLPLSRCEIWWSSSMTPTPGAVCVGVEHYADTGFIATSKQDPEGALFPPAETCRTELVAWAVVLGPKWSRPTGTLWPEVLKELGGAPRGDAWLTGSNSGADLCAVARGAVRVDVEGLADRTAVENHLVLPWRELLSRARTSAAGMSTAGLTSTGT